MCIYNNSKSLILSVVILLQKKMKEHPARHPLCSTSTSFCVGPFWWSLFMLISFIHEIPTQHIHTLTINTFSRYIISPFLTVHSMLCIAQLLLSNSTVFFLWRREIPLVVIRILSLYTPPLNTNCFLANLAISTFHICK